MSPTLVATRVFAGLQALTAEDPELLALLELAEGPALVDGDELPARLAAGSAVLTGVVSPPPTVVAYLTAYAQGPEAEATLAKIWHRVMACTERSACAARGLPFTVGQLRRADGPILGTTRPGLRRGDLELQIRVDEIS